jgi:type I site-specific restriction endonuclease
MVRIALVLAQLRWRCVAGVSARKGGSIWARSWRFCELAIGSNKVMKLQRYAGQQGLLRKPLPIALRQHLDHVAIAKLYRNRPLTAADIAELERMLIESGVGAPEEIGRASEEAQGLGLFVRSLVGLDRGAAKDAMAGFTAGKALSANQLEFINLVVDHLTAHGVMDPAQLYESPFTDIAAREPDELFDPAQVDELVSRLEAVKSTALAA